MFCTNCGKQLADGTAFCSQCGTPITGNTEAEINTTPVVGETTTLEANEYYAAENTQTAENPAPKKRKGVNLFAAIIAVVLVAAIAVVVCLGPLKGTMVSAFGSSEDYFTYVAEKNADKLAAEFSDAYANYLDNLKTETGAEASVTLNVGDKAKDLAENLLDEYNVTDFDVDWLNSIALDMDVSMAEKLIRVGAGLKLNNTELLNADAILDMDKGNFYAAVLSLSDEYLKGEFDLDADAAAVDAFSLKEIKNALPSDKTVEELLNKYLAVIYGQIDEIEKTKDVLKSGDIEQKVTVFEVKIDQKLGNKIAVAVLETAKDDELLKTVITDIGKHAEELDDTVDADTMYKEFQEGITDALDELKDADVEENETLATVTIYADASHDLVGGKIKADGEEVLYCATVRNGDNFEFELKSDVLVITGTGTEKKDVVSGEFVVKVEETKICTLTLTNFTTKDNLLNGKITITPTSDLFELFAVDGADASVISLANFELELNFKSKKDTAEFDINVLSGKELFAGITVSNKETKADKITLPANTVDADNAEEWLESLDVEKLLDKLEEAGVPEDLLSLIGG